MTPSRPPMPNLSDTARKFLVEYDARPQVPVEQQDPAVVEPEPRRVCSRGHKFTLPDKRRSIVGCCPACSDVNIHYRPMTAQEIAAEQLDKLEQRGAEMMARAKQIKSSSTKGPQDNEDLWAMTDDLPGREPGEDDVPEDMRE